jgi:hypothetical protein
MAVLWKEDSRPARGSWAPGDYVKHCRKCGEQFMGDKRAGSCADCAYAGVTSPNVSVGEG